jgi:hypothetical protein
MAGSGNKIDLAVVVNGQPVLVEVNLNAPLRTVIPKALEESGNTGQPPENWELRDADGAELDLDRKIGDYGFAPDVRLFLNLKAGIGG